MVFFKDVQAIHGLLPKQYLGEDRSFPHKNSSSDKPTVVDASQLFKQPHRATRPDHFVIILRGLPGNAFIFFTYVTIRLILWVFMGFEGFVDLGFFFFFFSYRSDHVGLTELDERKV